MPALSDQIDLLYANCASERVTLDGIAASHPFVYRLEECAPDAFNTQGDLVAPKFSGLSSIPPLDPKDMTLQALLEYVCLWDNKVSPAVKNRERPWLSATFSLPYLLYEGQRREDKIPKYALRPSDTEVVIIDVRRLRAATPTFLTKVELEERDPDDYLSNTPIDYGPYGYDVYQKAMRFMGVFQDVLIYGHVPRSAIVARWNYAAFKDTVLPLYHTCPTACVPKFHGRERWMFRHYLDHCLDNVQKSDRWGDLQVAINAVAERVRRRPRDLKPGHVGVPQNEAAAAAVASVVYILRFKSFEFGRVVEVVGDLSYLHRCILQHFGLPVSWR